jgi:uncharacterized membrane protein
MSKSVKLIAAVFPDREHAETIFDMLERMHKAVTITIHDVALVTKDDKGKLKIEQTHELTTGKGARRGAIIAGALGVIFPPAFLASALTGGLIGAIAGRFRDTGIKTDAMKDLADRLDGGKAAVFVIVDEENVLPVQNALSSYEGELAIIVIDEETMAELNKENFMRDAAVE